MFEILCNLTKFQRNLFLLNRTAIADGDKAAIALIYMLQLCTFFWCVCVAGGGGGGDKNNVLTKGKDI